VAVHEGPSRDHVTARLSLGHVQCAFASNTSQVTQKVVVLLICDESVNNETLASRQKVVDLCQRVADSFFGFHDAFGGMTSLAQRAG